MNEYDIQVDLEHGLLFHKQIDLVQNDYNSTVFNFKFNDKDYSNYMKVFQLEYPDGKTWTKEIKKNKITLADLNEENIYIPILTQSGKYYFDIAIYDENSKLTTTKKSYFKAREKISGEDIELDDRVPILDDLINSVTKNINETNNLDIDIEKSVITITKKDGTTKSENVKGEKGEKGDAGSIKFIIVNELPTEDIDVNAMYLKRIVEEEEQNIYQEYIYVNDTWELVGTAKVQVDLTEYVKNTDYAKSDKGGVVVVGDYSIDATPTGKLYAVPRLYDFYTNKMDGYGFISKGTLENVLNNRVATETQFGTVKTWTSTNGDGETGLNISTEV